MNRTARMTAVVTTITAALSLSSCTSTPARISALDREATAADALPA
jgi:starvation-inducible outer membrane lipoprotein